MQECLVAWEILTGNACKLDVSESGEMGSQTRFDPVSNCVFLGCDVMPGETQLSALDELSFVAVLAHEYTHFLRFGQTLPNYVLEEVSTHVQAAENDTLTPEDRCGLLRCAVEVLYAYRIKECP